MPSKKLNKVENYAANVLAGYMRSKIDANVLQPAIFSDLYGKKINAPYKAATTIQGAIRNKQARNEMAKMREQQIMRGFKKPNLPTSVVVEENFKKPYDDTSDQELVRLKFSLPAGGYKASWTRDQKDIYNAVVRRKFEISFKKANEEYKKSKK